MAVVKSDSLCISQKLQSLGCYEVCVNREGLEGSWVMSQLETRGKLLEHFGGPKSWCRSTGWGAWGPLASIFGIIRATSWPLPQLGCAFWHPSPENRKDRSMVSSLVMLGLLCLARCCINITYIVFFSLITEQQKRLSSLSGRWAICLFAC